MWIQSQCIFFLLYIFSIFRKSLDSVLAKLNPSSDSRNQSLDEVSLFSFYLGGFVTCLHIKLPVWENDLFLRE